MNYLEEREVRRRNKTRMRLPQLNKANRIAKRHAATSRYVRLAVSTPAPELVLA
jgi:hypothetical protein